jgi:hypothetical protein
MSPACPEVHLLEGSANIPAFVAGYGKDLYSSAGMEHGFTRIHTDFNIIQKYAAKGPINPKEQP